MADTEYVNIRCLYCTTVNTMSKADAERVLKAIIDGDYTKEQYTSQLQTCSQCHNQFSKERVVYALTGEETKFTKSEQFIEQNKADEPDPESKVDKQCIRVLKAEGVFYRILKLVFIEIPVAICVWIARAIDKISTVIVNCIMFIASWINWCIVRSILRIILVPGCPLFVGWAFWNIGTLKMHEWLLEVIPYATIAKDCTYPISQCAARGFPVTTAPNYFSATIIEVMALLVLVCIVWFYYLSIIGMMTSKDPELKIVQKAFKKKEEK